MANIVANTGWSKLSQPPADFFSDYKAHLLVGLLPILYQSYTANLVRYNED